ncbi:MAG: hypothetical protein BWY74_02831 [Firmicutes bacterium ADurb.Bin419]|nr:MAG: hypothetical protein BWY74_02831 [Firmicutes bacterium ADurb.Bin419]
MAKLERDLIDEINKYLRSSDNKTVLFWMRVHLGSFRNDFGVRIMTRKELVGTPDFLIVVWNKQKGLSIIFAEAKSDTGNLRTEQEEFFNRYSKIENIHPLVIRDIQELKNIINKIAYDRVQELPDIL